MSFPNSPLSLHVKERIEADMRAGVRTKTIIVTYGVAKQTIARYRRNLRFYNSVNAPYIMKPGPPAKLNNEVKEVGVDPLDTTSTNTFLGHSGLSTV